MGEMLINSMRGDIPIVIIRPTIIESTYKDPFPGWIQGNRCPFLTFNLCVCVYIYIYIYIYLFIFIDKRLDQVTLVICHKQKLSKKILEEIFY